MDVPKGWKAVALADVLDGSPQNGYSPRCPTKPNGRWILSLGAVTERGFDPTGIKPAPIDDDKVERFRLVPGDLLISRSNTRERVGFAGVYHGIPEWCAYPDLLVRLRTDPKHALPEYLESVLLSVEGRGYFESSARGTSGSMVKINRGIIERFEFLLPSLTEQRKIAAILSSVDEAIEKTQAVIDQVQVVKKGLMQELLTKGLPGRHKTFKQTEIGRVPESWQLRRLDSLGVVQTGLAKNKANVGDLDVPYLRVANVQDGYLDLAEIKRVSVSQQALDRYRLEIGDVLFTEGGDADKLGRGTVWNGEIPLCLHQNHVFAVRIDTAIILPEFLSLFGGCESGKK